MLLLDTHIYLWFVSENQLLPQWVSKKIQTNEKFLRFAHGQPVQAKA